MNPRPLLTRCIVLALLLSAAPVSARMYQWVDPDTGTPQLSGKPPWWYRGDEPGPRVFVVDDGKVVDDTAVNVSEAQRQLLRERAFQRAEQDEAEFQARLEAARRQREEPAPGEEAAPESGAGEAAAAAAEPAPEEKAAQEQAMRALVEEFERVQEEKALQVIHE